MSPFDSPLTDGPLMIEVSCALACAESAGEVILRFWRQAGIGESKAGGEPVSIADRQADELIRAALQEGFPADAILSEEHPDDGKRLGADRVWIVDPLDGTRDFLEHSRDFGVHVALAISGRPVLGVIHAPALERTWLGVPGQGAWARDARSAWTPIRTAQLGDPVRIAVTRRPLGPRTQKLRSHLPGHILVRRGGCGLKAALVAEGSCDVYAGVTRRMKEWDLCASHAVAVAAGGVCTDMAGQPLTYNAEDVVARGGFLVTSQAASRSLRDCFEAARVDLDAM